MANGPDYTRKWSICRAFATSGACARASCKFSHSLIDTARIVALVGEIINASFTSLPTTSTPSPSLTEQTFFLIEYTKYSLQTDAAHDSIQDAGSTVWRMRLLGGGRATLNSEGGTMSMQPTYPAKGQGKVAGVALTALEGRVFGCNATPDLTRPSLCRAHAEGTCKRGATCSFSHSLFDTNRIERLLERAVEEGGYKDYKPTLEIEYMGRRDAAKPLACLWRMTLRCVLGYHLKAAPQPVVVTSADLNMAMRMLEGQFTRSSASGKPDHAEAQPKKNTHTRGGRTRRPASPSSSAHSNRSFSGQRPSNLAGASTSSERPPSTPHATNPGRPPGQGRRTPPPSYQDAMHGSQPNASPSPAPSDAKRRS